MAKDKLTDYDSTASNNLDVGGISVAEGMLPSGVNNAIREQMSHLADFAAGTQPITKLATASIDANGGTIKLDGNYPVGTENVALGDQALDDGSLSGAYNTAIGHKALTANTTGQRNTAVGRTSLVGNTSGGYNTAIGMDTLPANTSGSYNTAVGEEALKANTTASDNTAVGYQAAYSTTTGGFNAVFGHKAWYGGTGTNNAVFGHTAYRDGGAGNNNAAFGYASMANNTGSHNSAFGNQSVQNNTSGNYNTGVGGYALFSNTTASNSTAVGYRALYSNTGAFNTSLGAYAGDNVTTGSYNTSLGYNSNPSAGTSTGQFTLGDGNITDLRCNDTSISSLSDSRDKTDIIDSPYGLNFINTVRPVQFLWATRDGNAKDGSTRIGFLAQELLAATDGNNAVLDLVLDDNPEKLEAKQGNLLPIAIKAIQELSAKNDALEARIAALES